MTARSPFLDIDPRDWTASNELAFCIRDRYPVSRGHTLVIPKRVVATWFDATREEQHALMQLVDEVKRALDIELHPDGYNVGFNAGEAAGQTVMHLHVHVIPRFHGDMDDPRGGVRGVIPGKQNYLIERAAPLSTGGESDPLARHIFPLFNDATEIAIVAAFVQESGLKRLGPEIDAALARGASVLVLTGDYLDITQASALEMLLDWQRATAFVDDEGELRGRLEARVIESAKLPGRTRSFHPKSWRFESAARGVAFVGSSNLSKSALDTGIEWNLRVDRDHEGPAYARVRAAFDSLWTTARVLDAAWVQAYAARARLAPQSLPAWEAEPDDVVPFHEPHDVQIEALAKLRQAREQQRRRALVVLATGLGKTWLAAFDYAQLWDELGYRPRLLFLAHRREILRQAAQTYRALLRHRGVTPSVGWFVEDEDDLSQDLVFGSVSKLARKEHIARLATQRFDYVVIDEVHHAAAASYRRVLDAIDPAFLLGLTATPDRADAADVRGLFDDYEAYRADIARGVEIDRLVPFHYYGVKDSIDYENIPWRRKDPEELAAAAQTEARMQSMWRAWQSHPGVRSLVFCCSVGHANYVRTWLRAHDVRVSAVYAGPGSDDREAALEQLKTGAIDALCAVDIFNEGVDIPTVDRVIMLRPTESGVVFMQQLGRGLRASEGKRALTVIDFVGNDRVFLGRLRTLLSLAGRASAQSLRRLLDATGPEELPAGCSVDLELEAKQMLSRLLGVRGSDEVGRIYRELRLERGERPTAGELQRMGYSPSTLRTPDGGFFDFVRAEGDLSEKESRVLDAASAFLRGVETADMTKSFKMITLEALIEGDALVTGMEVRDLARKSHAILRRSPELFADVTEADFDTITEANEKRWVAYWRKNPIDAWVTGTKRAGRAWFRLINDRFVLDLAVEESLQDDFANLTRELVDYQLARYRSRKKVRTGSLDAFRCRVFWNRRDPILKLPSRRGSTLPEGEVDVRLPSGEVWQFRFVKEACNVARPSGTQQNKLPDLLRRWFGPSAGHPGTAFDVQFRSGEEGLWIEPVKSKAVALESRRHVVWYPDLRAAAGHAQRASDGLEPERVALPIDTDDANILAVRVSGTSMDGGDSPLHDGDWAIMRLARSEPADRMKNQVVLVQVPHEAFGTQYQIKRLVRRDGRWLLTSDNPLGPTIEPTADMVTIARLVRGIRPEELGPTLGAVLSAVDLAQAFGLDELEPLSGRHDGHLFVFIDRKGVLLKPDRLHFDASQRRASETAFVLAKQPDATWRYLGVARWNDHDARWHIVPVDEGTWRVWGNGTTSGT